MLLASIIREQKKPQQASSTPRLTEALTESMGKFEGAKPAVNESPPGEDVKFRMSGLERLCPRMYALAVREQIGLLVALDSQTRWILGTGTAFHTQFQEDYLQTLGDVFQGWWRCRECGKVHRGGKLEKGMLSHLWIPRPEMCRALRPGEDPDECQSDNFEYVELEFEDEEHRITGHCDGVLVWDPDDIELLELKTINERGYQYVDPKVGGKPRSGHVIQAHGYLWGVEETGITKVRVVYIKKSYDPMVSVLAEHVVEKVQKYIDQIKKMLVDSQEAAQVESRYRMAVINNEDPLPEAPKLPVKLEACKRKSDYRAKYCMARDSCFHKKNKTA